MGWLRATVGIEVSIAHAAVGLTYFGLFYIFYGHANASAQERTKAESWG